MEKTLIGINWNGVNAVTIRGWLLTLGPKPLGGAKTGHEFHRPGRCYIEMFSKMSFDKSLDNTVNDVGTAFKPSRGITIISDCMSKVGDSRTKAFDRMTTL